MTHPIILVITHCLLTETEPSEGGGCLSLPSQRSVVSVTGAPEGLAPSDWSARRMAGNHAERVSPFRRSRASWGHLYGIATRRSHTIKSMLPKPCRERLALNPLVCCTFHRVTRAPLNREAGLLIPPPSKCHKMCFLGSASCKNASP